MMKIEDPEFLKCISSYDIIFLSECWFSKTSCKSLELSGFKVYCKARSRKRKAKRDSGGLCVLIKNNIDCYFEIFDWDNEDGLIFKVNESNTLLECDLYILFCYLRPNSSTRSDIENESDPFDILFQKVAELRNNNEIIIIGDLNSRTSTLQDFISFEDSNFDPFDDDDYANFCIDNNFLLQNNIEINRNNQDKKTNDFGNRLINLCCVSGLLICNGRLEGDKDGKFTYIDKKGKSTNDYCLISKGLLYLNNNFFVNELNVFSDHVPIVLKIFDFDFITNANNVPNDMNNFSHEVVYYKWKNDFHDDFNMNMNDESICKKLTDILCSLDKQNDVLDNTLIENCILELNAILENVANPLKHTFSNAPSDSCTDRHSQNTWYDNECRTKNKEFKAARNLFFDSKSDVDLQIMCNIRNTYRKLCRKKKSSYKIESANKILKLSKENSKLFWKKIKNKKNTKIPNLDFDNHFKQLFSTFPPDLSDTTKTTLEVHRILKPVTHDNFLDSAITLDELNLALRNLKNDKSPGSDKIINEFLKYNTDLFKKTVLMIFNVLFDKGYFPDVWSTGLIIPIFKAGDEHDVNNYRGISLLSCVGKLFTCIINNRLNKWAESQNVFDQNQYGFRDKKSTVDAMFILQSIVDTFIENGNMLFVSFIDLKKAFDSTNHEVLWYKLFKNGINTKIISLLQNMYNKMKLCVKSTFLQNSTTCTFCKSKHDEECIFCVSDEGHIPNDFLFSTKAGVLQGESLSPFLFSMYLNDINSYMSIDQNIGISIYDFYLILLLFADDMVLFSHSRQGLQRGLDRLYNYCVDWGLIVNTQKTKCLVFRKGGKRNAQDVWFYNDEPLETVQTFKYLGFVFASSGRFKIGIENVVLKGQRACFKMLSTIKDFSSLYPKNQISLFNSLVAAVLSYGCEVWGLAEAKKIETVHLSFLKYVLKVKKKYSKLCCI